jgi:WD40 repeat protein
MNKLALVIGNANYAFDPIPNAGNDAQLVAQALKERGFTVTQVKDADPDLIEESIRGFTLDAIEQNAMVLFYFAGHAVELNGAVYLLGTGISESFGPGAVLYGAFALSEFFRLSADVKLPRIVVLDACREAISHWTSDDWRLFTENISHERQKGVNRHDNTLIAYSTSSGDLAADGRGDNSLYTLELCEQIVRHGVTVENCFKDLGMSIIQQSEQKQRPWFYSSLNSHVSFSDLPAYCQIHNFQVPIKSLEGGLVPTPSGELMAFSQAGLLLHLNASGFTSQRWHELMCCCITPNLELIFVSPEGQLFTNDQTFKCPQASRYEVTLSPSGNSCLVFGNRSGQIFRRQAESWSKVFSWKEQKKHLMCARFVSEDVAMVGGESSQLMIIDNITAMPTRNVLDMRPRGHFYSMTALENGEVLCTHSGGEIWVVAPGNSTPLLWAELGRFVKTASARRSSIINNVNDDETVHRLVFEHESLSEEEVEFLEEHLASNDLLFSSVSPIHPLLAVANSEGLIFLIDTRTAVTVQIIDHGVGRSSGVDSLSFSSNGNLVVLGNSSISYYVPIFERGSEGLLPDL